MEPGGDLERPAKKLTFYYYDNSRHNYVYYIRFNAANGVLQAPGLNVGGGRTTSSTKGTLTCHWRTKPRVALGRYAAGDGAAEGVHMGGRARPTRGKRWGARDSE